MSDLLTRRGFTAAALAAGAGLWLPRGASAQRGLALTARLALEARRGRLLARLYVQHDGDEAVQLPGDAIELAGTLARVAPRVEVRRAEVRLASIARRASITSRAGPRLAVPKLVPRGEEVLYGSYSTPWPPGMRAPAADASATLSARAELIAGAWPIPEGAGPDHPARRRAAALDALRRIRARGTVGLTAG